jgi:SAM-dependent methyltransferase
MTQPGRPVDAWSSDHAYESFIGRWSRLVAPLFLRRLPALAGARWCDVGCGTGALAHAVIATEQPARVLGVDPSPAYLAAARQAPVGRPAVLAVAAGTATALPARDARFDRVVSALALNFVPQPIRALAEMRRTTRPGGMVAAYVWDYADGMELLRAFWDTATSLDPAASDLDEKHRFPLCRPDPLRTLFEAAGLADVDVAPIDVPTVFTDFDDLWRPFLGGQGPAPGYCSTLPDQQRGTLREHRRDRLQPGTDGTNALTARAWAVSGRVPGA